MHSLPIESLNTFANLTTAAIVWYTGRQLRDILKELRAEIKKREVP